MKVKIKFYDEVSMIVDRWKGFPKYLDGHLSWPGSKRRKELRKRIWEYGREHFGTSLENINLMKHTCYRWQGEAASTNSNNIDKAPRMLRIWNLS